MSPYPQPSAGLLPWGEALLAHEEGWLAPWAVPSRAGGERLHEEAEDPLLTPFQRDRQRVVHSRAFRRLQYKTQVFVNQEGDYYRTRLTHTLEVAQLARTVARALRLNEDLTETIALAHDLGHPPYGHAGERTLTALMAEHGGFEHNAQALRIVDLLERRHAAFRGLNLTRQVREGIWKRRDTPTSRHLGYGETFDRQASPFLEAQVADMVDSIAYDHHDLDDALKAGLLHPEDLRGVALWEEACAAADERLAAAGPRADRAERVRRQEILRWLRHEQLRDLLETTRARLAAAGVTSLQDVRRHPQPLVSLSAGMLQRKRALERFLEERVYRHWRVMRAVSKGERLLRRLFQAFLDDPRLLPEEYREWVGEVGLERGVCDYLAGMTDRYAAREHRQLFQVEEGP